MTVPSFLHSLQDPVAPAPKAHAMPRVIPLLVIAGPTACGKTAAAVRVARSVGGEIVSADSMQIYRRLEIGVAKPTSAERASVRFHLVDFVEPEQPYTVADFVTDARRAICQVWGRGNLPILCGGTGLYIRALLRRYLFPPSDPPETGLAPAERTPVRRRLHAELQALGCEALHRRLAAVDPQAARQICPADSKRVLRALEVALVSGRPMSEQRRVDADPADQYNLEVLVIARPREALYAGIGQRVDRMMAAGWLDEVRALHAQGYSPALQCLQALGYRHLLEWLVAQQAGAVQATLADVVESIKRDTRRFAKRQLTWFRSESGARWLEWETEKQFEQVTGEMCRAASRLRQAVNSPMLEMGDLL